MMGDIIRKVLRHPQSNDKGAALVEYGMLVGLIAVLCVTVVTTIGQEISGLLTSIATDFSVLISPAA